MRDSAFDWMVNTLQTSITDDKSFIWCTDEHARNGLPPTPHTNVHVITNRSDVAEEARSRELNVDFSDFDFTQYPDASVDGFFYRVSKEKPLVHHLLNQAWRCLKIGGTLWLSGLKNEGTKTYIDKIARLLGAEKRISKDGLVYSAKLIKLLPFEKQSQLDSCDYETTRPIENNSGLTLVSKPGLFGWNKIDTGSALLVQQLERVFANRPAPQTGLDLGCGYGFLTVAAHHLASTAADRWILTDNNAAALKIATTNLQLNGINGQVVASDAGFGLPIKANLLLCNPPFHQGFSVDGDLTDKFLTNASQLLAPDGIALFVVNQFIPLEKKARPLFKQVTPLIDNGSFKVISLSL